MLRFTVELATYTTNFLNLLSVKEVLTFLCTNLLYELGQEYILSCWAYCSICIHHLHSTCMSKKSWPSFYKVNEHINWVKTSCTDSIHRFSRSGVYIIYSSISFRSITWSSCPRLICANWICASYYVSHKSWPILLKVSRNIEMWQDFLDIR